MTTGKRRILHAAAANFGGQFRVMVAGDPDPVMPVDEMAQQRGIARRQPRRTGIVVKAVAEANDTLRPVVAAQPLQGSQRRRRIVGRQQPSADGKGRTLLEVQIGDYQRARIGHDRRARQIELERRTCEGKRSGMHGGEYNGLAGWKQRSRPDNPIHARIRIADRLPAPVRMAGRLRF